MSESRENPTQDRPKRFWPCSLCGRQVRNRRPFSGPLYCLRCRFREWRSDVLDRLVVWLLRAF